MSVAETLGRFLRRTISALRRDHAIKKNLVRILRARVMTCANRVGLCDEDSPTTDLRIRRITTYDAVNDDDRYDARVNTNALQRKFEVLRYFSRLASLPSSYCWVLVEWFLMLILWTSHDTLYVKQFLSAKIVRFKPFIVCTCRIKLWGFSGNNSLHSTQATFTTLDMIRVVEIV